MLHNREKLHARRLERQAEFERRNRAALEDEKAALDPAERKRRLAEDRARRIREHEERNRIARQNEQLRGVKMRRAPQEDKMLRPWDTGLENKAIVERAPTAQFASARAEELAKTGGLSAHDFLAHTPSGAKGYTVGDVQAVLKAASERGPDREPGPDDGELPLDEEEVVNEPYPLPEVPSSPEEIPEEDFEGEIEDDEDQSGQSR